MLNRAMMQSARDSWNTPECVIERVRGVGRIALDPCSNPDSITDASVSWTENGLDRDWIAATKGRGIVYVNPPYGRNIGAWVERCAMHEGSVEVIALLPARTDARWFEWAWTATALCFWRGRLRFLGAPSSAPFPSVVAYWGPRHAAFARAFWTAGRLVYP